MKILYITGLYPPPETANGIRAYYFVREMIRSSFDVFVIETVSRARSDVGGFFGEKVVRLHTHSNSNILRAVDLFYKARSTTKNLVKIVTKYNPDLVISTWPSHDSMLLGKIISEKIKSPLVVDIQDLSDYFLSLRPEIYYKIFSAVYYNIFDKIYEIIADADKIITVTEPFKWILEKRIGRKDIEIIYNGVDVEIYKKMILISPQKKIKSDNVTGVFLGDLNWWYHMLDRIIKAIAILIGSGKISRQNFTFKIIGVGRLMKRYKELTKSLGIENIVKFEGYLEREDLVKNLVSADFGTLGRPSIRNLWIIASTRTTLYEYMAGGLPIFSFGPPYSYTKHLVESKKIGYYVPSDDPISLARELLKFINNLDSFDREKIHRTSYEYDWKNLASKFISIISKCC